MVERLQSAVLERPASVIPARAPVLSGELYDDFKKVEDRLCARTADILIAEACKDRRFRNVLNNKGKNFGDVLGNQFSLGGVVKALVENESISGAIRVIKKAKNSIENGQFGLNGDKDQVIDRLKKLRQTLIDADPNHKVDSCLDDRLSCSIR